MAAKRLLGKNSTDANKSWSLDTLPEVAIVAITSSKKQKDVAEFVNFMVTSLQRNATWINNLVQKTPTFKCALFVGSGPNRFQIKDIIYPAKEEPFKVEIELQDSEDHDKIGIGAIFKITNSELLNLLEYVRYHMSEHSMLRADMLTGKALGISYVAMKPLSDRQFRVCDRFIIDSSTAVISKRKRKKTEPLITSFRKMKRTT